MGKADDEDGRRGRTLRGWLRVALLAAAALPAGECGRAQHRQDVILATTTSVQDSGLLEALLPPFEAGTPYRVKTIAVGTGQALELARHGAVDVVLAHAPKAEMELLESGAVADRELVMSNEFVVVGPAADPAGAGQHRRAADAFAGIAAAGAPFVSRGDASGTHQRELELWQQAGVEPQGAWYQQAGVGMGQTLSLASERGAYALADRATFAVLLPHLRLRIVLEGDPELQNPYHVLRVSARRFPRVNAAGAAALVAYLLAPETQARIGAFGRERYGQPLFVPAMGGGSEPPPGR